MWLDGQSPAAQQILERCHKLKVLAYGYNPSSALEHEFWQDTHMTATHITISRRSKLDEASWLPLFSTALTRHCTHLELEIGGRNSVAEALILIPTLTHLAVHTSRRDALTSKNNNPIKQELKSIVMPPSNEVTAYAATRTVFSTECKRRCVESEEPSC